MKHPEFDQPPVRPVLGAEREVKPQLQVKALSNHLPKNSLLDRPTLFLL